MGAISMGSTGAPFSFGYQSSIVTTFYKDQDFINLRLKALPIAPGTPFTNTPLLCNFTFTIIGCEE
jgi:hypothetical protein